jgi:hypothetical protein
MSSCSPNHYSCSTTAQPTSRPLVQTLTSVIQHWATPIDAGEWWDRPAVPFNVVLAADTASASAVRDRSAAAGAAGIELD